MLEKRRHERFPAFSTLELLLRENQDPPVQVQMRVHNQSKSGFGAVYRGDKIEAMKREGSLLFPDNVLIEFKLAWSQHVMNDIYFLGFAIEPEGTTQSMLAS